MSQIEQCRHLLKVLSDQQAHVIQRVIVLVKDLRTVSARFVVMLFVGCTAEFELERRVNNGAVSLCSLIVFQTQVLAQQQQVFL